MRCLICEKFSFLHICKVCQKEFLVPKPEIRTLPNELKVLSFFAYDEIDFLLKTKHSYIGHYIYHILAKRCMKAFSEAFKYEVLLDVIPIDDKTTDVYSHTAILAKAFKSKFLKPKYHTLHSQNEISYSGKNLAFRESNPRDFKLLKDLDKGVILVDDIITSGTTLLEASNFLNENNIQTVMAVTLADANR
jgi:competence protein ComFC